MGFFIGDFVWNLEMRIAKINYKLASRHKNINKKDILGMNFAKKSDRKQIIVIPKRFCKKLNI